MEELADLFENLKKTGSREARDKIIKEYLKVVFPISRKFYGYGENLEDLIQVGFIGLIKAVDNFDPDRGVRFTTYATHCITGEIRHYLRDKTEAIKSPRWLRRLNSEVAGFIESFLQQNKRFPTIKEIAENLNIAEDGIIEILNSRKLLSLNADSDEKGKGIDYERIRAVRYENFKLPLEDRLVVEDAVEKLVIIEKRIVYLFFYVDLSQTEIGKLLGIPQKRVSRLLHRAVDNLKKIIFK
jgi:RNA polymerase sigma-B factor